MLLLPLRFLYIINLYVTMVFHIFEKVKIINKLGRVNCVDEKIALGEAVSDQIYKQQQPFGHLKAQRCGNLIKSMNAARNEPVKSDYLVI